MTSDPDAIWRRPAGDTPAQAPEPAGTDQPYAGPPRTRRPTPTPAAPLIRQLPPPRVLPAQDNHAIDAEEHDALIVTYGVAIIAGVLATLVLLFVILRALSG